MFISSFFQHVQKLSKLLFQLGFSEYLGKGKGGVYKGGLSGKVILPGTTSSNFASFICCSTQLPPYHSQLPSSLQLPDFSNPLAFHYLRSFWAHQALFHFSIHNHALLRVFLCITRKEFLGFSLKDCANCPI